MKRYPPCPHGTCDVQTDLLNHIEHRCDSCFGAPKVLGLSSSEFAAFVKLTNAKVEPNWCVRVYHPYGSTIVTLREFLK